MFVGYPLSHKDKLTFSFSIREGPLQSLPKQFCNDAESYGTLSPILFVFQNGGPK